MIIIVTSVRLPFIVLLFIFTMNSPFPSANSTINFNEYIYWYKHNISYQNAKKQYLSNTNNKSQMVFIKSYCVFNGEIVAFKVGVIPLSYLNELIVRYINQLYLRIIIECVGMHELDFVMIQNHTF